MCRTVGAFVPSREVDGAVEALPVSCPYVDGALGTPCRWRGTLKNFVDHEHLCSEEEQQPAAGARRGTKRERSDDDIEEHSNNDYDDTEEDSNNDHDDADDVVAPPPPKYSLRSGRERRTPDDCSERRRWR